MSNKSKRVAKGTINNSDIKKRLMRVLIIVGVAILGVDTLIIGNVAYIGKWLSCGGQSSIITVKPRDTFLESPEYQISKPTYGISKYPLIPMSTTKVFCTDTQAREFIAKQYNE